MINSFKVTKHACTSSWSPLAHSIHHTYHQVTVMNKQKKTKAINNSYIYIHISCKCDTNCAGHFTLDAHASRPVACIIWQVTQLGNVPVVALAERPQMRPKSPGLDLLKNVNGSGVRELQSMHTACRLQGSVPEDSVRHYGHSGLREALSMRSVYIPKILSAVYHLLVSTNAGNCNISNEQW